MKPISILHNGGGWITNIGNAFVDYGGMESLREAAQNAEIHFTSVMNRWISTHMNKGIYGLALKKSSNLSNVLNLQYSAKCDYISQSGAFLASHWFELQGETIIRCKEKGSKVIFNGAGMTDTTYNDDEIQRTRKWIKKIKPDIFISRDEQSFNEYKDLVEHSYNGIDVAFFLNRSYTPMKLDLSPYYTLNFDRTDEPNLDDLNLKTNDTILRTHHSFWHNFSLKEYFRMQKNYYGKNNTLISEIPEDYLNVYGNTKGTFSDRVHACIATLSYGMPARLFSKTPRSQLFNRVGAADITKMTVIPDKNKIDSEKDKQIKFLSEILSNR
jgi:hypothetical protein